MGDSRMAVDCRSLQIGGVDDRLLGLLCSSLMERCVIILPTVSRKALTLDAGAKLIPLAKGEGWPRLDDLHQRLRLDGAGA